MKIGVQELLLIFIVALIVLGPDKLPIYAQKFGEALKEFRKFSSDATKDIRESIVEPLEEAQRPLREALEPISEFEKEVRNDVTGIKKSLEDIGKPVKSTKDEKKVSADVQAADTDGGAEDSGKQDSDIIPLANTATELTPNPEVSGEEPEKQGSDMEISEENTAELLPDAELTLKPEQPDKIRESSQEESGTMDLADVLEAT